MDSVLPEGCKCVFKTRSLPGSSRRASPGGSTIGGLAGLPKQKMSIRVKRFGFDLQLHAGEAAFRRFFFAARGLRAIHQKICVMPQPLFSVMNFDRPYKTRRIQ